MVANPFADTGPRVQQLCEGSYSERSMGPQGLPVAGFVYLQSPRSNRRSLPLKVKKLDVSSFLT